MNKPYFNPLVIDNQPLRGEYALYLKVGGEEGEEHRISPGFKEERLLALFVQRNIEVIQTLAYCKNVLENEAMVNVIGLLREGKLK